MKNIAIIGAGGFGRETKVLIDAINLKCETYNIIGFFDDNFEKNIIINGLPILGKVSDINNIDKPLSLAFGVAAPNVKKEIFDKIVNKNIDYPNLIHPSVLISNDDVILGKGITICAGSIITCNIKIKNFVTLNLSCTVGHDTIVEDFCSFMPTVNISGEVLIKESVYVGTGAKIINQLEIGKNTIVGAGAVVAKSLPDNCTAVGIPAKPIKFH